MLVTTSHSLRFGQDCIELWGLLVVEDLHRLCRLFLTDLLKMGFCLCVWDSPYDQPPHLEPNQRELIFQCRENEFTLWRGTEKFRVNLKHGTQSITDDLVQDLINDDMWVAVERPESLLDVEVHPHVFAEGEKWFDVSGVVWPQLLTKEDVVIVPGHDFESIEVCGRNAQAVSAFLAERLEHHASTDPWVIEHRSQLIWDPELVCWHLPGVW
mgnify:CR=1 FL=1